jgi:nucleoside-diphosphate-sugar epimerase
VTGTVLVTGASGFVGSQTLEPLALRGFCVHAYGRRHPAGPVAAFHEGDLFDRTRVAAVLAAIRPSHVLHLAWDVTPGRFWTARENLDWTGATLALGRACLDSGVGRFVGVGSCAEYDWSADPDLPRREDAPLRPTKLYGLCKTAAFELLTAAFADAGVSFAWGRLFHLYGPGEPAGRLVPSVVAALVAGREARCGPGTERRDYMEVHDAGAALAALLDSGVCGPVNVATGESVRVGDVVRLLGVLAGRPELVCVGALPARPGEPPAMPADVSRLRVEVGFRTAWTLRDGLQACLDAGRSEIDSAEAAISRFLEVSCG